MPSAEGVRRTVLRSGRTLDRRVPFFVWHLLQQRFAAASGVKELPASWSDLTNPLLFKQVALADPTKSGSAAKAFEMVIQQQMQELVREAGVEAPEILAIGWKRGLEIIQAASANARYFTDAAEKFSSTSRSATPRPACASIFTEDSRARR